MTQQMMKILVVIGEPKDDVFGLVFVVKLTQSHDIDISVYDTRSDALNIKFYKGTNRVFQK